MAVSKTINGVRHARGCACPLCDPDNRLQRQARETALATRRAYPLSGRVVPLPLTADRARRPLLAPFETEKTRRFRQLLREGVSSKQAAEIIESELKEIAP